jgi:hypothetical protein
MVPLGDIDQVKAHFRPFGDSINLDVNVQRTWKSFQAHPVVLLGDVGQVEAHFGLFGDSINL